MRLKLKGREGGDGIGLLNRILRKKHNWTGSDGDN